MSDVDNIDEVRELLHTIDHNESDEKVVSQNDMLFDSPSDGQQRVDSPGLAPLERLQQEMRHEFEKTREEFAKSEEVERLQENVRNLQEENAQLRQEREQLQGRLTDSSQSNPNQEDYASAPPRATSTSDQSEEQAEVQTMEGNHWGAAAGQTVFLLIGVAVALTPHLGELAPWPDAVMITAPVWFGLVFVFMMYERRSVINEAQKA